MRAHKIGFVLDGGAHKGEFAKRLRRLGYKGRILSVEPLPGPFAELQRLAAQDGRWQCVNVALATKCGETTLYANPISEVSSLLPATGLENTQGWQTTTPLKVTALTIDALLSESLWEGGLYLKLDIQGYEMQALSGAASALERTSAVELELSTVELYRGSVLFPDAVWRLQQLGFSLFSLEPVLVDFGSGRVLQLDCIFVNDGEAKRTQ